MAMLPVMLCRALLPTTPSLVAAQCLQASKLHKHADVSCISTIRLGIQRDDHLLHAAPSPSNVLQDAAVQACSQLVFAHGGTVNTCMHATTIKSYTYTWATNEPVR